MKAPRTKTKILVDGGDVIETLRVREVLGYVDGQTTNPSLIAKNPEVRAMVAAGHKMTSEQENDEYRKIVREISPLVGDAGVSIEVFADLDTKAESMIAQARDMFSWIPNAHIKFPCTHEGLRAAQMSVAEGIRVNMTLCFSQQQAAAVYAATKGFAGVADKMHPAYVSPFIGRLDDRGENGMDLIKNIKRMYAAGDGHVAVLAASIRNLDHLMYAFALDCELATVPTKILEEWAAKGFPLPDANYVYPGASAGAGSVAGSVAGPAGSALRPIPYEQLDLNAPWESFDITHELTTPGIEKFVADYKATLAS